jgi:MoxR-like ATPase
VLDRLAASATLNYPPFEEAVKLAADRNVIQQDPIEAAKVCEVLKAGEVHAYQDFVRDTVEVPLAIARYIVRLVYATRPPEDKEVGDDEVDFSLYEKYMPEEYKKDNLIYVGDSNRGIIWLSSLARANAVLAGRTVVTDQDVKDVAVSVLAHRLTLNDQKSHKYPRHIGRVIIKKLLEKVETTD